ncbi:hypothetical protein PQX77_011560, partial [Marasmius sp. AFHP31]
MSYVPLFPAPLHPGCREQPLLALGTGPTLGTSLSNVSIPNVEESGFLYCYRIEGGSPYRDSELYKVGRTIDYAKRE